MPIEGQAGGIQGQKTVVHLGSPINVSIPTLCHPELNKNKRPGTSGPFVLETIRFYLELYLCCLRQIAQHVVQNAAMFDIFNLNFRIDPALDLDCAGRPISRCNRAGHCR